jgi:hypothetical protein
MEKLGLGLRETLAGKGETPGALWPPQAAKNRNKNKKMVVASHAHRKRNLPMHPLVASRLFPMGEPLNGMENC